VRRLSFLFVATWLSGASAQADVLPKIVVFDSSLDKSGARISVADISPGFPRDWSGYDALVLELRASSSQRFSVRIHTGEKGASGTRFSRILFQPYPKLWIRAAIPVSLLSEPPKTGHDMAAVGNRSRPGYFLGLWGPFVPLTDVREIEFEMEHPAGSPRLEIRRVELVKQSPGDAVLEGQPFVDQFGQFQHESWDGKAGSLRRPGATRSNPSPPVTSAIVPTAGSRAPRPARQGSSGLKRSMGSGGSSILTGTGSCLWGAMS
jgi:hypothetical protein